MDVDNIAPGLDFVRVLEERVAECDVVLAVIGKGWIDARDATGARRLDDPDDFVRVEISSALSKDKRVIPVLVGEAPMPRPEELPEVLRPLARRNAVRLTHERFRVDMQGLIKALQQALEEIDALRKMGAEAGRQAQAAQEREQVQSVANEQAGAHPATMASDDPAVRSFRDNNSNGSDADQVRERLRSPEPSPKWKLSRPTIVILSALGVVLIAGAVLFWRNDTSAPSLTPHAAAIATAPPTPVAPAQPAPVKAAPAATVPAAPVAPAPPAPVNNQVSPAVVTKSVKREVSLGYLNLRSGPGQDQKVLARIPAGTTGVVVTGSCIAPRDGSSSYPFCPVEWNGLRGWVSSNGLE